ncbi:cell surface glycoprotein 1 [Folsomia candida]|uniref:cell surface glycoprotein 1 n=1 Tax=Folsomia candida TaxID=158441 RepID=UPI000B8F3BF6|nr:cell surface glycoprotein 1 [Folsomia candida]
MPELRIFDTKTVETGEIERFDLGGESGGSGGGGAGGKKESSGDLFDRLLKRSVVGVEGEGTEEVGDEGDEGGEEHEKTPPETGDEGGVPDDPPEEEPVTMETESVAMETPETTENTEEIDTEALLLATMPPVLPPPLTDHAHQNYSETLEEEEMMEEETAPPSVTTPPTPEETTPTSPPSPPTPPPPPQTPLATIPQKPTATIKPQQITMETVLESQDSSKILELTTPLIETDNVVHLVPVENADGSITYMLLSLNGGNELRVNVGAGDSEATPTGRDLSTLEAIILDKPMDMGSILSMEQGSVAADEQVEGFSTATITTATTPSSSEGRHGDSWSNPL